MTPQHAHTHPHGCHRHYMYPTPTAPASCLPLQRAKRLEDLLGVPLHLGLDVREHLDQLAVLLCVCMCSMGTERFE